jgi:deoxyadenosine/deoxycytidine kinase
MRFVLVGLPGVGKSTVGPLLANATRGRVAKEDTPTFNYIEDALVDPAQYAALSQVEFMLDKARTELASNCETLWQEDDTRYTHHVWTRALARDGRIDSRAASLLNDLAFVLDATCPQPAGIVALELSLAEIEQRIAARGRTYEVSAGKLDKGFRRLLAALDHEHRRYVTSASGVDPPLWRIDASQTPEAIAREVIACTRAPADRPSA